MCLITGLLFLILGNQYEEGWMRHFSYIMAVMNFISGTLENPIIQAFIKGFKGE